MQNLDNNSHHIIEQPVADIDLTAYQQRAFTASPEAWGDQVLIPMINNLEPLG